MIIARGNHIRHYLNNRLILDFTDSGMSRTKLRQLGEDLEARGYQFTHSKSPWLGQETYSGKAPDKTQIVLSLPIVKNRLTVDQGATPCTITWGAEEGGDLIQAVRYRIRELRMK